MDGDSNAWMAEPKPQESVEGAGSDGQAAGDMLAGSSRMDISDSDKSVRGAQQHSLPGANDLRTEWVRIISCSCAGSFDDKHAGQEQEVEVADDVSYTLDMLTDPEAVSVLKDLAVTMFDLDGATS